MGLMLHNPSWSLNDSPSGWGGCVFKNNCIKTDRPSPQSPVVWRDTPYSFATLQSSYPAHWSGNIEQNPLFFSNNVDTFTTDITSPLYRTGIASWSGDLSSASHGIGYPDSCYGDWYWYKLRYNSPCIDRGIVVQDPNGEYVRSINARWGWYDLSYAGSAPDIGAYERPGQSGAPPSPPTLTSRPGIK
jgi:hypothetical protein